VGQAVIELQQRYRDARVVYLSATGATQFEDMGCARCCAAVLLCCCAAAALLCCCAAALLRCCAAVLLCCCAAALLCCCAAALLCCCAAVLLLRCCAAVLLRCCAAVLLRFCCAAALLRCACALLLRSAAALCVCLLALRALFCSRPPLTLLPIPIPIPSLYPYIPSPPASYMTRLGLWGSGCAFPDAAAVSAVLKNSSGSMEMLAVSLKVRRADCVCVCGVCWVFASDSLRRSRSLARALSRSRAERATN
jgi:hypothetical protein